MVAVSREKIEKGGGALGIVPEQYRAALKQRFICLLRSLCLLRGTHANYHTERLIAAMMQADQQCCKNKEKARHINVLIRAWQAGMRGSLPDEKEDILVALCLRVGRHWVKCYEDNSEE